MGEIYGFTARLVHCDQTGLVKGRLASECLCLSLHVIQATASRGSSCAVLSPGAGKAFDHLEWICLWTPLEHVGFGVRFVNTLHTLYNVMLQRLSTDWDKLFP